MPPRKKADPDQDIARLLESLSWVRPGQSGYTMLDRHRDFKAVFTTDQGKRVLAQIIAFCDGASIAEDQANEHGRLAFAAGRRRAGLWITSMLVPPAADPRQTKDQS